MNITGIITEYNPFHYGHLYHLNKSKEISNANIILCIMNGNYTQRGLPAITDKWSRAKMALKSGVDITIELPLVYGIRSANYFAEGAIKLLSATNIVNNFVFGSESGELKNLFTIAKFLSNKNSDYENLIKKYLRSGFSYPSAREKALNEFFNNNEIIKEIKNPNNILGIEYIRAILKNDFSLKPLTIKRTTNNYHSTKINGEFASGTALRNLIRNNKLKELKKLIPNSSFEILQREINDNKIPVNKEKLSYPILTKLRKTSPQQLKKYAEINNGLENRFIEAAQKSGNYEELVQYINTKSLTQNRIQRNLLHILFDLTNEEFEKIDKNGPAYLRVLAVNDKGKKVLSQLKEKADIPLITKITDYLDEINLNSKNPIIKQLSYEVLADDIYSLLYKNPKYRQGRQDFYQKLVTS